MIISDHHRFIFVHIPKSGGTSCHQALAPLLSAHEQKHWAKPGTSKHVTLLQVKRRMDCWAWWPIGERRRFGDYFTFGFVRHPWERLVSLFHYLKDTLIVPGARTMTTFDRFMEDMADNVDWIEKLHSMKPQIDYLQDERGRMMVKFIGRYEDLEYDFRVACEQIGIQASLPHLNRSTSGKRRIPYQHYYTPRTRELVRRRFAADIDCFGYTFGEEMRRGAA